MHPSAASSLFPTSAPDNRDARSGNISIVTTPSPVAVVEGENRGYGIDVQSGSNRVRSHLYSMVALGVMLPVVYFHWHF